jgi:tetratricopeptide (TPR) repeat protein
MVTVISTVRRLEYTRGYLALGMLREARNELAAIDTEDRLKPEARALRVELSCASKDWRSMARTARGLAEDFPEEAQWWVHWAYALRERQQIKEARQIALRGLERHPDEAILHYNLACYLSLLGEFDEAREHLNRSISLDEGFQEESVKDPDLDGLRTWCSNV